MKPLNVLIIEDLDMLKDLMVLAVQRHGTIRGLDHKVRTAESVNDTFSTLALFSPDVVFSDQNIKGGLGTETFGAIRAKNPRVFIMLASSDDLSHVNHTADLFRTKPVSPDQLYKVLDKVSTD